MEFLNEYSVPVIVGICLCIGFILKNLVTTDKINKFIPLIVAVIGVVVNAWLNAWTVTPEILLSGMFSGLASTGMHQLFKQFIEKSE
mgnify:CR=1 FL=1